jgi:hypothetical protein
MHECTLMVTHKTLLSPPGRPEMPEGMASTQLDVCGQSPNPPPRQHRNMVVQQAGRPRSRAHPRVGRSTPASSDTIVDFPAPEGPANENTQPNYSRQLCAKSWTQPKRSPEPSAGLMEQPHCMERAYLVAQHTVLECTSNQRQQLLPPSRTTFPAPAPQSAPLDVQGTGSGALSAAATKCSTQARGWWLARTELRCSLKPATAHRSPTAKAT